MPTRSHTTFKKRQKELARQEKQREKAAKRVQRKLEKNLPDTGEESTMGEESLVDALAPDEAVPDAEAPHSGPA